jgi:glycosyltransferase involved in cell wall biosynthesis
VTAAARPDAVPEISIVVPAYHEQDTIPVLIPEISASLSGTSHEIIVVDDGSLDATWQRIDALRQTHPHVVGLRLTRNFGHQAAILAGLNAARGAAVIMMDADGQHPPSHLPAFIDAWRNGAAVVQGVRTETEGEGRLKRLTSRAFYRLLSWVGGPQIPIGSADFRLISRPVVDVVLQSVGPLLFLRGLIPWLGYPAAQVPFRAERRRAGATSYTWFRMVRFSLHGLLSFTTIPLRLATLLGMTVAAFSFVYLIIVVAAWRFNAAVVPGWASVMGLLALLGGIQLVTIGVVGEYVCRMFVAHLNRPHFVVRDQI